MSKISHRELSKIKEEIEEHLAKGDLMPAIGTMLSCEAFRKFRKELILQSAKVSNLNKNARLGGHSQKLILEERNRITSAIIELYIKVFDGDSKSNNRLNGYSTSPKIQHFLVGSDKQTLHQAIGITSSPSQKYIDEFYEQDRFEEGWWPYLRGDRQKSLKIPVTKILLGQNQNHFNSHRSSSENITDWKKEIAMAMKCNAAIVVIVDPFSLYISEILSLAKEIDESSNFNFVVLIPLCETLDKKTRKILRYNIRRTFENQSRSRIPDLFYPELKNLTDLTRSLKKALQYIHNEYAKLGKEISLTSTRKASNVLISMSREDAPQSLSEFNIPIDPIKLKTNDRKLSDNSLLTPPRLESED